MCKIQNTYTCQNVFKIHFKLQIQQKYLKYTGYFKILSSLSMGRGRGGRGNGKEAG